MCLRSLCLVGSDSVVIRTGWSTGHVKFNSALQTRQICGLRGWGNVSLRGTKQFQQTQDTYLLHLSRSKNVNNFLCFLCISCDVLSSMATFISKEFYFIIKYQFISFCCKKVSLKLLKTFFSILKFKLFFFYCTFHSDPDKSVRDVAGNIFQLM